MSAGPRFDALLDSLLLRRVDGKLMKALALVLLASALHAQILAPVTPHMSEEIWQSFHPGKSVHLSAWPADDGTLVSEDAERQCAFLNGIATLARQHKAERKLPLNAEIASADISCGFAISGIEEEIGATARVKVINFTAGEGSIKFSQ